MVIRWKKYKQIVILTGAGISVASGLSTYRGINSTITASCNVPTIDAFKKDPMQVWDFFELMRIKIVKAKPNLGHYKLEELESNLCSSQRFTLITQNIDSLHKLSGSKNVIESHGNIREIICSNPKCFTSRLINESLDYMPFKNCTKCDSPLRHNIVFFGEYLPVSIEMAIKYALRDVDLFIAIGTSGTVSPASNYVNSAAYANARTIYINAEPMSPKNPAFNESIIGRAEEVLRNLF